MFQVPNQFRVRTGPMGTDESHGNNGAFLVPSGWPFPTAQLRVIASDNAGWEHVSVSLYDRCPTWDEMCEVKSLFWAPEDRVAQFHPPQSEYVNCHPFCLHLWRPVGGDFFPLPPPYLVGPLKDSPR